MSTKERTTTPRVLWMVLIGMAVAGLAGCFGGGGNNGETADAGAPVYVKSYSVPGADVDHLASAETPDGGSYVLTATSPADLPQALRLARLDAAGDVLWAQGIIQTERPVGIPADEYIAATVVPNANNEEFWIVVRNSQGHWLRRLDANGQALPAQQSPKTLEDLLGHTDRSNHHFGVGHIAGTPSGGIIAVGTVDSRFWSARFDRNGGLIGGSVVSAKPSVFSAYASLSELNFPVEINGIRVASDDSLLVFGSGLSGRRREGWLAVFAPDGLLRFQGQPGEASKINDAIFIAGENAAAATIIAVGRTGNDSTLVHLAMDGSVLQAVTTDNGGDSHSDFYRSVIADTRHDVWVLGAANANDGDVDDDRYSLPVLERWRRVDGHYVRQDYFNGETPLESPTALSYSVNPVSFDRLWLLQRGRQGGQEDLILSARRADQPQQTLFQFAVLEGTGGWSRSLHNTADGGVLIAHTFGLIKLDASGTELWRHGLRRWGDNELATDGEYRIREVDNDGAVTALAALPQGGVVVALGKQGLLAEAGDDFTQLLRFDANGRLLDANQIDHTMLIGMALIDGDGDFRRGDAVLLAAKGDDGTELLRVTPTGEVIDRRRLTGFHARRLYGNDARLVLEGADGESLAVLTRTGETVTKWRTGVHYLHSALAADGSLYLILTRDQSGSRWDQGSAVSVQAIDPFGNVRWENVYELAAAFPDGDNPAFRAPDLTVLADGGLLLHGARERDDGSVECAFRLQCSDAVSIKLRPDGSVVWATAYAAAKTDGFGAAAYASRDFGALLYGASNSFEYPARSLFAARVDANGEVGANCQARASYPTTVSATELTPAPSRNGELPQVTLERPVSHPVPIQTPPASFVVARACGGVSQAPSLKVAVTGAGKVTSDPAGVECRAGEGHDCEQAYATGTVVKLQAQADPGARFIAWGGQCAAFGDRESITLTMNASLDCSAQFSAGETGGGNGQPTLNVAITGTGSGRVTADPGNIDCRQGGMGVCLWTYPTGTTVTLTAQAETGSRFVRWVGDCASDTGGINVSPLAFVINRNMNCSAEFGPIAGSGQGQIAIQFAGSGDGEVMGVNVSGLSCFKSRPLDNCQAEFPLGSEVQLDIIPFTPSWIGQVQGCTTYLWERGRCIINVTGVHVISITLDSPAPPPDTVTLRVEMSAQDRLRGRVRSADERLGLGCGDVWINCAISVARGTDVVLVAEAFDLYEFDRWGGQCADSAREPTITVHMDRDKTCTALFRVRHFNVSVGVNDAATDTGNAGSIISDPAGIVCGHGHNNCDEDLPLDSTVVLWARSFNTPRFVFERWDGDCAGQGERATLVVTRSLHCNAFFRDTGIGRVDVSIRGAGQGRVSTPNPGQIDCTSGGGQCSFEYPIGTIVQLNLSPFTPSGLGAVSGCVVNDSRLSCLVTVTGRESVDVQFVP